MTPAPLPPLLSVCGDPLVGGEAAADAPRGPRSPACHPLTGPVPAGRVWGHSERDCAPFMPKPSPAWLRSLPSADTVASEKARAPSSFT